MEFFQPLEGHVVLRTHGTFSEHQVYTLNGELFARKGNGFIRLMQHNATSKPGSFWDQLRLDRDTAYQMGRLVLTGSVSNHSIAAE